MTITPEQFADYKKLIANTKHDRNQLRRERRRARQVLKFIDSIKHRLHVDEYMRFEQMKKDYLSKKL